MRARYSGTVSCRFIGGAIGHTGDESFVRVPSLCGYMVVSPAHPPPQAGAYHWAAKGTKRKSWSFAGSASWNETVLFLAPRDTILSWLLYPHFRGREGVKLWPSSRQT